MRCSPFIRSLIVNLIFFATIQGFLAPDAKASEMMGDPLECELYLAVPLYAVINPLLIEAPSLNPKDKDKERDKEKKGWIKQYKIKKIKRPIKPIVPPQAPRPKKIKRFQ